MVESTPIVEEVDEGVGTSKSDPTLSKPETLVGTAPDKNSDSPKKAKAKHSHRNTISKNYAKSSKSKKNKVIDAVKASESDSECDASSDSSSDSSDSDSDWGATTKTSNKSKKKAKAKAKAKKRVLKKEEKQQKTQKDISNSDLDSDDDEDHSPSHEKAHASSIDRRLENMEALLSSMAVQNGQKPLDAGAADLANQGGSHPTLAMPALSPTATEYTGNLLFDREVALNRVALNRAGRNSLQPPARGRHGRFNAAQAYRDLESGDLDVAEGGVKKPKKPDFKRVDYVWDATRYTYKLQDTAKAIKEDKFDGYVFHVRRTFDHDGVYIRTFVDIKSKLLRECLQDVMKNVPSMSLVDDTPKLDPNMLFLYVEDLRKHLGELKHLEPAGQTSKERKKNQKRLDEKRTHLKLLVKYVDKDYADTKKCLEPMFKSGIVTYEYLWALFKPGTICFTCAYDHKDTPRAFRVTTAERHKTMMKGESYYVTGKYLEYDGKRFGYGGLCSDIPEFQGARKITDLPCYPLIYRKDESKMRRTLTARGKKFVLLSGRHFKAYTGVAFIKRRKSIIKFNISNSRIMVDPAIFRRINPNYMVSLVKPKNHDVLTLGDDSSDEDEYDGDESGACGCYDDSDNEDESGCGAPSLKRRKNVTKIFRDEKGQVHMVSVPRDESDEPSEEYLDELPEAKEEGLEPVKAYQTTEHNAAEKSDQLVNGEDPSDATKDASTTDEQTGAKTPDSSEADDKTGKHKVRSKCEEIILTDEDYLIASPLVLGFSFSEKQWLEFDVSNITEIKWNEDAWDSLVLNSDTKDLIQALVQSRKNNAASTIDDVIQGKGKGLVTVLHGPPGTGKTLTAEGIGELLRCPLYMVSAGELGTDPRYLEQELQRVLDICHAWGAILLLDEADVFLEKRNMQDIHRNALVSVFLRQLEYFQGILFLTTNRVETFDEAFQSRIHIALRYDRLDAKAKLAIFKLFLHRVKAHGKLEVQDFSEEDLRQLARRDLNGREIKNVMGSAQDMAINKGEALSMRHIRLVLDVHAKFGQDLKGGTGFEDAMRSYF